MDILQHNFNNDESESDESYHASGSGSSEDESGSEESAPEKHENDNGKKKRKRQTKKTVKQQQEDEPTTSTIRTRSGRTATKVVEKHESIASKLPEISDDFFNDFLSTAATTTKPSPLPQKPKEERLDKPTKLSSNENQQQHNTNNSQQTIDELFADDTSESPSQTTQSSIKMQQSTIQKPQKREFDKIADSFQQQPPIKKSVLAQSRDAWSDFKEETGIDDELQSVNRGKQGFLERQEFLHRADYRQFEKEKDVRAHARKARDRHTAGGI